MTSASGSSAIVESPVAPPGLAPTPRTTFKRHPERGTHERAAIDAILDEALICHLGVVVDGAPRVLPTAHVRVGDAVYVHGARANRLFAAALSGPSCLTVTLLDGIVFARSWFHHSMNFRSAVVYGQAEEVTEPTEKLAALRALIEHVANGRADETRAPTDAEFRSTLVLKLPIIEGSAKVRSGPPLDGPELLGDASWAGELPLVTRALAPRDDPSLRGGIELSGAVKGRAAVLSR